MKDEVMEGVGVRTIEEAAMNLMTHVYSRERYLQEGAGYVFLEEQSSVLMKMQNPVGDIFVGWLNRRID